MVKCPCCMEQTQQESMRVSEVREALICYLCAYAGKDKGKWGIDLVKPSKELREYFEAQNKFMIAYNCSEDKKEVERARSNYEKLRIKRVPKLVVVVEDVDGISPLAEFTDMNHAYAKAFGWLGRNFTQTSKTSWISMYGSVIQISEM